jgi:mono/diheme cytochrome c family protein
MTRCRRAVLAFVALLAVSVLTRSFSNREAEAAPPEKGPAAKVVAPAAKDAFAEKIRPIFTQYCTTCHNDKKMSAGLSLEPYVSTSMARKAPDLWEKVREMVENKQMPPKSKPQPTDAERKAIIAWIDSVATKVDCGLARDPGRPTIRRLNRNEYNNTIRDLVGVDFKPADSFPADDVGYGFDNIGDVLSMPPLLLEKYLTAAETIVNKAIVIPKTVTAMKDTRRPQNVRTTLGPFARQDNNRRIALTSNGAAFFDYEFLYAGEYIIRARAYGDQAGDELPKLEMQIDRKPIGEHKVAALADKPQTYETRTKISAGRHDVRFAFTNDFEEKADKDGKKKDRNLYIEFMEVEGPFQPELPPPPESHKRIMVATPTGDNDREAAAKKIIESFATRAYRRPVRPDEVARLMKLFQFAEAQKGPFEESIKHVVKAILVSPHFLFRIERDAEPNNPQAIHPVSQYELATRLSYFIWSSMPDEELFRLAGEGKLREPGVLEGQVRRMLKDPRASALVQNFAGQWLMLRTLATMTPDKTTYRTFDASLLSAMVRETELYFEHVMREDRSVLEFLDSDYTFVNDRLARHYGIEGVTSSQFRKVSLTNKNRGGIVTHGSVLTVTSNPTRTSPVKRGKWILENILGTPPPPPPPDVPELENDSKAVLTGSLRQRMEKHRENPSCATCHAKLDPLGFGLENFDGVGAFRQYDGKFKIDPAGELPDGSKFSGPAELRKVLLAKADLFRKNLAEKMLTYALGRGLEYYDRCATDDIVAALKKGDDRFAALMIAVVQSDPFQKRRGSTMMKKE